MNQSSPQLNIDQELASWGRALDVVTEIAEAMEGWGTPDEERFHRLYGEELEEE